MAGLIEHHVSSSKGCKGVCYQSRCRGWARWVNTEHHNCRVAKAMITFKGAAGVGRQRQGKVSCAWHQAAITAGGMGCWAVGYILA